MNKYFKNMIFACSAVSFGVASGDVVKVPEETAVAPVVETESQDTCKCCGKDAYAGAYIVAGVGFDMTRNEALTKLHINNERVALLGNGDLDSQKKHFKRPMFSLAAGYGDFVTDSFYLGAELGIDFLPNKTAKFDFPEFGEGNLGTYQLKIRGIVPSFSIRLGQGLPCCNALIYEKLGFAIQDSRFSAPLIKDEVIKTRRITPVIGLGIEKNLNKNFNGRLEADYRLGASRRKTDLSIYNPDTGDEIGQRELINGSVKNKVRGYSVRLMLSYNFHNCGDENTEH